MRYNSQCILVFSSTTIIPKKRAYARFCVIETVFLNYLFVTAPFFTFNYDNCLVRCKQKEYTLLEKREKLYG